MGAGAAEEQWGLGLKSALSGQLHRQQDSGLTGLPLAVQQMASVCLWCFSKAVELPGTVSAKVSLDLTLTWNYLC